MMKLLIIFLISLEIYVHCSRSTWSSLQSTSKNLSSSAWEASKFALQPQPIEGSKFTKRQENYLHYNEELPSLKGASVCNGENYTICFNDLINYIKLGQNDIQLTNNTDVIIVVGLSGVGKSTLVQFIANDTNTLEAVCKGTRCNITDDSGSIGSNIISQTFIPNLVIDNTTDNTVAIPLYDMPGFNDNRNETVEIANSFFVKKVLENAQRVKIVAVARKADLSTSDKMRFPTFLENLCKLIKDPFKFSNAITIVANMAEYHNPNEDHFIDYFDFMNQVNDSLTSFVKPEYLEASKELMTILMKQTQNPDEEPIPTNLGLMRSPVKKGSIRNDNTFRKDYVYLRHIIYNTTNYISKNDNDFGFAISAESELFIVKAFETIRYNIIAIMKSINNTITEDLPSGFERWANTGLAADNFPEQISNLVTASYDFIKETNVTPSYYINCTWKQISAFNDIVNLYKLQLETPLVFMDYAFTILPDIILRQDTWIEPLYEIHRNVKEHPKTLGAIDTVCENVKKLYIEFVNAVVERFSDGFKEFALTGSTNGTFNLYLKNLLTASYGFLNEADREPSYYKNGIWNATSKFVDSDIILNYKSTLEPKFKFFDSVFLILPKVDLQKGKWNQTLNGIKSSIIQNEKVKRAINIVIENVDKLYTYMAETVANRFSDSFNKLAQTGSVNATFRSCLVNLTTASYEFLNEANREPSYYKNGIWNAISKFVDTDIMSTYKPTLEPKFNFFDSVFIIMPKVDLQKEKWNQTLNGIKSRIINKAKSIVDSVIGEVNKLYNDMANTIADRFSEGFYKMSQTDAINATFKAYLDKLLNASYPFLNEADREPSYYKNGIWNTTSKFVDADIISNYKSKIEPKFRFLDTYFLIMPKVDLQKQKWNQTLNGIRSRIIEKDKTKQASKTLFNRFKTQFSTLTETYALHTILEHNFLPDVFEKKDRLDMLANNSTKLEATFQILKANVTYLSQYLKNVTADYSSLTHAIIPNIIRYDLLEMLEKLEMLEWKTMDWGGVHLTFYKGLVSEEKEFTTTLITILDKDLSSSQIQSKRIENFHSWWQTNSHLLPSTTMKQFWDKSEKLKLTFCRSYTTWDKFWSILNTRHAILKRIERIVSLLNVLFLGQPDCSLSKNNKLLYIGNYLSFKNVPICEVSSVQNVILLAIDTIYFDKAITGSIYNKMDNINIVAIAPTLNVPEGNTIIDLGGINGTTYGSNPGSPGSHGRSGTPGTPAGSFYGMFSKKIGSFKDVLLNGGTGGRGEDGKGGIDGKSASHKYFEASNEQHCAAWSGGKIQVRLLPNSCNRNIHCDDSWCKCHAGNNGVLVYIDGFKGTSGTNGGNGGDGKPGGKGGNYTMVDTIGASTWRLGKNGNNGVGGNQGKGGKGGKNGEILKVVLDDVTSGGQKRCKERSRTFSDAGFSNNGLNGAQGKSGEGTNGGSRLPIESLLKDHKNLLSYRMKMFMENEFLHRKIKSFLPALGKHF